MTTASSLCPTCPLRVLEGALIQSMNGVMTIDDRKRVMRAAKGVARMAKLPKAMKPRGMLGVRKIAISKLPTKKTGCRVCLSVIEKDGPLVPMVRTMARKSAVSVYDRRALENQTRRMLQLLKSMRGEEEE